MAEFDLQTMAHALAVNKENSTPQLDRIRQFIKDIKTVTPAAAFSIESKSRAKKLLNWMHPERQNSRFTDDHLAATLADMVIESSVRLSELALIMENALAAFELESPK